MKIYTIAFVMLAMACAISVNSQALGPAEPGIITEAPISQDVEPPDSTAGQIILSEFLIEPQPAPRPAPRPPQPATRPAPRPPQPATRPAPTTTRPIHTTLQPAPRPAPLPGTSGQKQTYRLSSGAEELGIDNSNPATFSCEGRIYGYYADQGRNCQVFHVCVPFAGKKRHSMYSFFCGNQTIFDQADLVCSRPSEAPPCEMAHTFYGVNEKFGMTNN